MQNENCSCILYTHNICNLFDNDNDMFTLKVVNGIHKGTFEIFRVEC